MKNAERGRRRLVSYLMLGLCLIALLLACLFTRWILALLALIPALLYLWLGRSARDRSPDFPSEDTGQTIADPPADAYVRFACRGCGATLRVRRGIGLIRAVCPRCGSETVEDTDIPLPTEAQGRPQIAFTPSHDSQHGGHPLDY